MINTKIELCNIEKSYNSPVIKNLSYTFEAGKMYVIKGVSGCGKTTLLNIIGGIETDFGGEIRKTPFDGQAEIKPGFIFQQSLLLSNITVMENLLLLKNDSAGICAIAERFGISDKLNKYPRQLSGGERQRAAIVRTLLQAPDILLADEPTASLDGANSENTVRAIAELKSPDRAVIVATHEHCFDSFADEILYLNYGVIEKTEKLQPQALPAAADVRQNGTDTKAKFSYIKYAMRRNPKLLKIGTLLPLILVFFVMLLVSTVQHNFSDEYFRFIKVKYPMDMLAINQSELERFEYRDSVKLYDNYTAAENGVNAYYLMPEKDSVFKIDGMIEYGRFPENNNEILASRDFIKNCFSDENFEQYIGKKITFKGKTFYICGITADLSREDINNNIVADLYYRKKIAENSVFIPYESIKAIGERQNEDIIMGSLDGLCENETLINALNRVLVHPAANLFYDRIYGMQDIINIVTAVLTAILFICYVMFCIFMLSVIRVELFYRKRELGFLQIFGLGKKKIMRLIMSEYIIKITASLLAAVIIYLPVCIAYGIISGSFIMFNPVFAPVIIISLYSVYCLIAARCAKRFLKKSVISLITV